MSFARSCLALLAGGVCLCSAEEITLVTGETLHEARVLRQDGESVTLAHTAGVARVMYDRLTPELQQRFGLTPEAVQARREKAQAAEKERAIAREKKMAEQRAALAHSNLSPRYVTGVEVSVLYGSWGEVSAPVAEYLAAEWNRREAMRCGLTIEADRYRDDALKLLPRVQQEQAEAKQKRENAAVLESRLEETQEQLRQTRVTIRKLEAEAKSPPAQTTTVIATAEPTYVPVPVYQPQPVALPPVRVARPPQPPVVRPIPPRRITVPPAPGRSVSAPRH